MYEIDGISAAEGRRNHLNEHQDLSRDLEELSY